MLNTQVRVGESAINNEALTKQGDDEVRIPRL